ncbi:putative endonuclease [Parelusimicrobium proximum]|uniref:GIY-YIG nuclease family protein n=1 Tax=Parelusimicrobium proximum TaxID=3228953 RepID=UPI003D17CFA2
MRKTYAVYILTNQAKRVLYTGVTSNLPVRIWQHKNKIIKGFTEKYNVSKLVYYEFFEEVSMAIAREKQIKKYIRKKKIELIESINPSWLDLSGEFTV